MVSAIANRLILRMSIDLTMDETFMIMIVWSNEVLEEDGARVALQQLGPLDDKAVAQRID